MHKWLQLPATPTDDPLATVYPINHYKKSHVYAVTRINPIYVDDEHNNGTWIKSGSSGYDSHPHSDHSSLDKNSPPATKCLRNGTASPPPSPSDRSSGSLQYRTTAPWLSPIKEGVIDVHQYCIPRPVWPGRDDAHRFPDLERIPRVKCCKHCARCRCRGSNGNGSSSSGSNGDGTVTIAGGSYSGYSSAYGGSGGGTVSTNSTGTGGGVGGGSGSGDGGDGACSCSDDATPSSVTASVKSDPQSPALALEPRFGDGVNNKTLVNNWNSIDLRLNQKTDNLQYDCGAMLRGLQFTLDAQQAEKLMQKIKVGKKHRCWCRLVTACLGLIMFLVSVITVSLALTRGQKMFGSL